MLNTELGVKKQLKVFKKNVIWYMNVINECVYHISVVFYPNTAAVGMTIINHFRNATVGSYHKGTVAIIYEDEDAQYFAQL